MVGGSFADRARMAWGIVAKRQFQGVVPDGVIPPRGMSRRGSALVTDATSLRHSAVWACLRLRADLISTFPVDCFRSSGGLDLEVKRPLVLVEPGGEEWDYVDWMWASQHTFDLTGNIVGLITEYDGNNLPARIDLQPSSRVTVQQRKNLPYPVYKIDGTEYKNVPGQRKQVWHEKQYPQAGLPIGLSPVMYAAWSVGEFLSIQDFALDWFGGGAVPKAAMRNKSRKLDEKEIKSAKQWYRDVINNGDLLVYGNDWEYEMIQAEQAGVEWLTARAATIPDISRFFGCPADLIDAAVSGESITYANISQRNLEFLILHLGPAVAKREKNLSKLMAAPRFVKLNTDALLRMDPETRAKVIGMRIDQRTLTLTEARALDNLGPLTDADFAEFARAFPIKSAVTKPEQVASQRALEAWMHDTSAPISPAPYGARELTR